MNLLGLITYQLSWENSKHPVKYFSRPTTYTMPFVEYANDDDNTIYNFQ